MLAIEHTVMILGGGIRGAAVAALLARTQQCQVRLLEREWVAAGATSTNHGRLHSGTSLWRRPDLTDIIQRRRAGCELIHSIPGTTSTELNSLHLIEAAEDLQQFEAVCDQQSIACVRRSPSVLPKGWISAGQFAGAFEIPEFSFNPAELAARLAAYAQLLGAEISVNTTVRALDRGQQRQYRIHATNGRTYEADVVINVLGAWVRSLESDLALPQLDLEWPQQRLLCVHAAELSVPVTLDQVVTVIDKANRIPSALPHGPWIIFGCDLTDSEQLSLPSPDTQFDVPWRNFRPETMDARVLEVNETYFLPLRGAAAQLFSFSGIYPRLQSDPDRHFRIHQSPEVPGYYALSGGNATTALIDAFDVVSTVLSQLELSEPWTLERTGQLQGQLIADLPATKYAPSPGMVWQEHKSHRSVGETTVTNRRAC